MAQLINEAKRMQLLAGLINESQLNENRYPNHKMSYSQLKTHGSVSMPYILKDEDLDKFVEKLKSPNNPKPEIYVTRNSHTSTIDGNYYEDTIIIDKYAPNAGGKSGKEMEQIAKDLDFKYAQGKDIQESLNIDTAVNEALKAHRKQK